MSYKLTAIQAGVLALLSPMVLAANPFIVRDIRVEGIQRTEAGTVFNYLPIHVGDTVDEDSVARAVKALFGTGFYRDVRIEVDNDVLIVIVDERPAISQVAFSGNKEFTSDVLLKGLKDIGIADSRTFDRSMLEKAEQEIKRLYLTRSFYAVSVRTTVSPMERNRVAINFEITEGQVARIKKIGIIGAKAFSESRLLDLMALEETGGLFSWFAEDKYSKQKLQADIEEIKTWYLDRGYLNFTIESTQVSISPDKKDVYITIAINEGEQYRVSSVKLAGELLIPEDELRRLVTVKSGEVFSRSSVNETTKALSDRLGNDGYAFANVNAAPELNEETKEVALTFFVDPGRRAYVNRINVTGNQRSRDEVVRREMRQVEGAWFDRERVDRSKLNVDRTGYFEDVNIDTVPVPGTSDQVDLTVAVKEKPTGALTLGVGYSATEKVVLSGSISEANIFGTGSSLTLNLNSGKINRNLGVSYTNPYWTVDGVSRGFDLYNRRVDPTSLTVGSYKSDAVGGGVRFGVPIAEDDSISFGLSGDRTKLQLFDSSPIQYKRFVERYGDVNTSVLATAGWARDLRDSLTYPTSGTYQRVSSEAAIPPGELRYARVNYQWQRYFALNRTFTLMLNTDLGFAQGYGGNPVPFYKNYFAGGIGTVRGFKDSSLGPKVVDANGNTTDEALGGTRRWLGSAELLFPFPGMKEKSRSLRLSAFIDAGEVWDQQTKFKGSDIKVGAGVALAWSSPIGPLKFSVGVPVKKKAGDKAQRFQFQIGTVF